jgi:undecaprenol kinase
MNVSKFFRSFTFAYNGLKIATKQQNMKFHLTSAVVVIIAAFVTGISLLEWAILLIVIGMMISLEMVNTAIEAVVDLTSPHIHPLAKIAKDVAAGAVLVFAFVSVIIGVLIFIPKWF